MQHATLWKRILNNGINALDSERGYVERLTLDIIRSPIIVGPALEPKAPSAPSPSC
jgi:hypothetical protein